MGSKGLIFLANAIKDLTTQTNNIRTILWCAVQISSIVIYNTNQADIRVKSPDQTHFDYKIKENYYIKNRFELKTDLLLDNLFISE